MQGRLNNLGRRDFIGTVARREDIKSIEGRFRGDRGIAYFLISGSATPARMGFISIAPRHEEGIGVWPLVLQLSQLCNLNYGYIFDWTSDGGAVFYAQGITLGVGEIDDDSADADSRWFNERVLNHGDGRYKKFGMLRGLYGINIINQDHINRTIGRETLAELVVRMGWGS